MSHCNSHQEICIKWEHRYWTSYQTMNEGGGENALRRFSVEEMAKKVALKWVNMWKNLVRKWSLFYQVHQAPAWIGASTQWVQTGAQTGRIWKVSGLAYLFIIMQKQNMYKNEIFYSLIQNIIWSNPSEKKSSLSIKLGATFFELCCYPISYPYVCEYFWPPLFMKNETNMTIPD